MAGKKGTKRYPESIKNEIRQKQENGQSVKSLSREYGISRWAIQTWCGLSKGHPRAPKARGRKPAKTLQEYKYENKRLKMENELLRDFLLLTERK
ncbi:MAG: transposase [Clostridia bacterium]|nr:transposase [Clostridia bacterium]